MVLRIGVQSTLRERARVFKVEGISHMHNLLNLRYELEV